MNTFILLLFCSVLVHQVVSLNDDSPSTCGANAKCKTCTAENSQYKSDCSLQVSIECTYMENGVKQSCFSPDDLGSRDPSPSIIVTEEECKTNPPHIEATIVYKMCNLNGQAFVPNEEPTFIKYREKNYTETRDADSIINVDDWDDVLGASSCRSYTEIRTINPCENEFAAMFVSMDGQLRKQGPNYCRCFLRQYSRSKVKPYVDGPPNSECDVFFETFDDTSPFVPPTTEVKRVRRIRIKTSCRDFDSKSISLVQWRGDGTKLEVALNDMTTPQNEYISICPQKEDGCDVILPELFISYTESSYGLVENSCDGSQCCQEELDIYGARDKNLSSTSFPKFRSCRAVREKAYSREYKSLPDSWGIICS